MDCGYVGSRVLCSLNTTARKYLPSLPSLISAEVQSKPGTSPLGLPVTLPETGCATAKSSWRQRVLFHQGGLLYWFPMVALEPLLFTQPPSSSSYTSLFSLLWVNLNPSTVGSPNPKLPTHRFTHSNFCGGHSNIRIFPLATGLGPISSWWVNSTTTLCCYGNIIFWHLLQN